MTDTTRIDDDRPSKPTGMALLPEFFERYFAFFRPGHTTGVVPARIKELARLEVASHNGCDN